MTEVDLSSRDLAARYGVRSASALVVIAVLVIPVVLGVRWWPSDVSSQHRVPAAVLAADDLDAYRNYAESNRPSIAPVVISFHDIQPVRPAAGPYVVTPEHLEEIASMLDVAGYTSITGEQMAAYLAGAPLPPRAVWITFDDGTKGVWQWADPILRRHGFTATAFVITGSVGEQQPYYLTWAELERMHDSGRWDIQAHTHEGHRRIGANADGSEQGAFTVTRAWLHDADRHETLAEWQARVSADLDRCVLEIEAHGFGHPLFFAQPFAAVRSTSYPEIGPLLDEMIEARFVASVANAFNATTVGPDQVLDRHVLRVAVRRDTTTRDLFERLHDLDDAPAA